MATKSTSKLGLLALAAVGVAVLVQGGDLEELADDLLGDVFTADPVVIEEDGVALLVAVDQEAALEQCKPARIVADRRCGDTKVVVFDATKMAFVTRNISLAWGEGKPPILTKDASREVANRRAACPRSFKRPHGGSCDEYPFASTRQGGAGARTEEVPARENSCQGGTLARGYNLAGIREGDDYLVVIANPSAIANGPYAGVDVAKDRSCQA
ncbi:NucA/NucB deoxyribonuclease domain-containing protein [Actinokineospora guangxiensis]|uniref:NucA/NucB deoxyribonuclease domain-containing protein n=1 Tax=Actinokineospora guangxiensis TaxID=1490288 RepID=A0ABW0EZC8_9PSEU